MLGSIKYNLMHLLDFSGRDARQTFWFYVLFLFIIGMVVSMVAIVPAMMTMFAGAFQAAQGGDPEAVNAYMAANMGGVMSDAIWVSAVWSLLQIPLLAAALVRRLHDSDLSGWWGWIPGLAQVGAVVWSIQTIEDMEAMMSSAMAAPGDSSYLAMQQSMGVGSLVGWIPVLCVVVFGIRKSTEGPNRFAAEPVRF